ncbi:alpha/beta fold hydrolase BchO [Halorhodospira abdelmalekii]|uniref:alpha/beta fold hydrolase BchO n=1 Tax=Halorhodospira abdelmalekii TaxID=421629 RepID=UPI0019079DD5|nr:alpha/beta fold hydrolase BchO [Halorhodospira abdelmalekii]
MSALAHDTEANDEPPLQPRWAVEGRDWPGRSASDFLEAAGIRWHYQLFPATVDADAGVDADADADADTAATESPAPVVLLVHGTGAAGHSWYPLVPELRQHFTVLVVDLPGHGFTSAPPPQRLATAAMAEDLAALLRALDVEPDWVVGHSAGAALLAQMILDEQIAPAALVSINGSLLPRQGRFARLFMPLARWVINRDVVARRAARRLGDEQQVAELFEQAGSPLPAAQIERYARLAQTPQHTGSALRMMAHWRLDRLEPRLPELALPVLLIVGEADPLVDPEEAVTVAQQLPRATVVTLPERGHFAHEEDPQQTLAVLRRFLAQLP